MERPHQNKRDPIYPPKTLQYTFNILNQSLIHTNLYIFPTKLGETLIQENTHQLTLKVVDIHPGPALRKACSLEHLDVEAVGGPESREHSPAKFSGTTLPGLAHSLKSSTAHKENPAHGSPDSRDHSTAHPSGLTNPSDPTEGDPPKQESDHPPKSPPKTPPVPTAHGKSGRLEAKLTPLQKRRLKTLKDKGKTPKVPSSLPT